LAGAFSFSCFPRRSLAHLSSSHLSFWVHHRRNSRGRAAAPSSSGNRPTAPPTASQSFGPCVPTLETPRLRQARRPDRERIGHCQSLIRRRSILERFQLRRIPWEKPTPFSRQGLDLELCTGPSVKPIAGLSLQALPTCHISPPTPATLRPTAPPIAHPACVVHQHLRPSSQNRRCSSATTNNLPVFFPSFSFVAGHASFNFARPHRQPTCSAALG
jgi:hypothetical protein